MDPTTPDFKALAELFGGGVAFTVLLAVVIAFMRGDIIPRRVYEMWTESIIHRTVEKLLKELGLTKDQD